MDEVYFVLIKLVDAFTDNLSLVTGLGCVLTRLTLIMLFAVALSTTVLVFRC